MLALSVCIAVAAGQNSSSVCAAVRDCVARLDRGEECDVLPVPARAMVLPIPNGAPVEVRQLRPGVWLFRDPVVMSLILRRGSRVVLLDAPDSATGSNKPDGSQTRLTDAVLQILNGTSATRVDIVYTHAHFDHIGAAPLVVQWVRRTFPKARLEIYGTADIRPLIRESVSKRAIPPTIVVRRRGKTLYLGGGLRVRMDILGGHSGRDLALHIPRTGSYPAILMMIDVVFPRWAPFHALAITEDVGRYIAVHDELLKYDFDIYVGGHLRVGDRRDVADNLRFVKDLVRTADEALKTTTQAQRAAEGLFNVFTPGTTEFGNWWVAAIKAGRALDARRCARMMIEKWGCRIAGAAVTMQSHCFTALSYLYVDV